MMREVYINFTAGGSVDVHRAAGRPGGNEWSPERDTHATIFLARCLSLTDPRPIFIFLRSSTQYIDFSIFSGQLPI